MVESSLKFLKNAAIFLAAVAGLATISTSVYAEETKTESQSSNTNSAQTLLQVSPVSKQVVLEAGKSAEYTMKISNAGTNPFKYQLYSAPYSVSNDENEDYVISFTNENNRTQISRWITFKKDDQYVEKAELSIDPGESQEITYRISVPENIPSGGQYCAIFAETEPSQSAQNAGGIRTVSRVAMIIYGRTNGETEESAEITSFKIPSFMTGGNIKVESKIKNGGNTDFDASIHFEVKSSFGEELYNNSTAVTLLPETERKVTLEWENTPQMGIFQVTQRVIVFDKVQEETKTLIIFPVYMIILTIIVLTSLIVWIIITVKKRKERKARLAV